ncbi:MAG TPA: hypothetical protein VK891_06875, partial [Euzebyales bacterium]|nr:hypothetical protein [Euzebyales bacterium]
QFDGHAVHTIVSSPTLRCVQTVEPLARRRGVEVRTATELGVDGDPDAAVARLLEGGAAHTVWCSHGELISEVLARLRARDAPLGDGAAWPKGSTWCLEVVDGSVVRAQYVAPPAT